MYTQDFYIDTRVGNNSFSFKERGNKKLFIPKLKKIESFDEVQLHPYLSPTLSYEEREQAAKKITFEEYDFDGNIQTCYGLENLYQLDWRGKPLYLVDNHNHVFYFWYLVRSEGIISDRAILYHIDEHADMRDPCDYLLKPESLDLERVFEYTNYVLNVGNYIIPAQKEGLIGEVVQIRSEDALRKNYYLQNKKNSVILNLDLDFFEPELDYIDYNLKKRVILDIAAKADLITVCTSPYFIEQERALEIFKKIFC